MCCVSATRSAIVIPRKNTAIASAAIWPSEIDPSVRPRTKNAISSSVSSAPSRFLRMISCGKKRSLAIRDPDVLDLHGLAQELAALGLLRIEPVAPTAVVDPRALHVAHARLLHDRAAGVRPDVPERVDVVVRGEDGRQCVALAGDDVDR